MVRQYRYALKEELWELGHLQTEKDEDPFEAAKRELEEEWRDGGTVHQPGVLYRLWLFERENLYLGGQGLKPTSQHLDDGGILMWQACRLTTYCRW